MTDKIQIQNVNSVHNKIICEPGIAQELAEHFKFFVNGYKFMPKFRARLWDGKIRLFNQRNNTLYYGLNHKVEQFCKDRDYEIEHLSDFSATEFSVKEAKKFIEKLELPFEVRDYQLKTFINCVRQNRGLVLSPTASGKSLIIYLLCREYSCKTLIIVPTTSLIHQMASDFESYGYNKEIQKIYAGQEDEIYCPITVSTWQSIYKYPKWWFDQFGLVIVDEAHLAQAKSLVGIMEKTPTVQHKFGFTGTLDGSLTNEMVLEGLFGPIIKLTTTTELMDQGHLSQLKIKCIVLKYSDEQRKEVSKKDYKGELDWLFAHHRRNNFIKNLALSLTGNTLLLFRFVDDHGIPLYNSIKAEADCPVYYVAGSVEGEAREEIRKIVETHEKSIIVASAGVFSTGVNIVRLHNIIAAAPSKSRIRILQSIGRGLRVADKKDQCTLFDISDDLTWKNRKNFTLTHFHERVKLYNKEGFDYRVYNVNLKG
jgi:superfamily II DNA or RNA helicase